MPTTSRRQHVNNLPGLPVLVTGWRDKTVGASLADGIAADADRVISAGLQVDGANEIDPQTRFWNDSEVAVCQQPNKVAWLLQKHTIV